MEYKYLGVTLTTNLSWSKHINSICTEPLEKLGYLCRILTAAPRVTKLLMYKSLVRRVLEYASIVWYSHKKEE